MNGPVINIFDACCRIDSILRNMLKKEVNGIPQFSDLFMIPGTWNEISPKECDSFKWTEFLVTYKSIVTLL